LADEGLAPESDRTEARRFFDLYHLGRTPVDEWIGFQLREFANHTPREMQELADRHYRMRIAEYVYPEARREINKYRGLDLPICL